MSLYFCKIITKLVCKYFRNAYVFFCCSQINCQNFKINLPSNSHHKQSLRNLTTPTTMCKEKRDNNCQTHTHTLTLTLRVLSHQQANISIPRVLQSQINLQMQVCMYVCVCGNVFAPEWRFVISVCWPGQAIQPACLSVCPYVSQLPVVCDFILLLLIFSDLIKQFKNHLIERESILLDR